MTPFYEALNRVSSTDSDDKQVRIAVFGDSFIEADIFTADLREMLQKQFGGCGVGFCYHHFHDKRLPSYGTAYIWRMVQPCSNRQYLFR